MKKRFMAIAVCLLVMLPLLQGCLPTDIVGNYAPVIISFSPTTNPEVNVNGTIQFSVQATDANFDTLSYAWDAAGKGSFSPANGYTTTWTAPATAGTYQVKVTITDGKGGQASRQWTVSVFGNQPGNHAPVINSFSPTANPQVGASETVQFSIQATDADSDTLSYAWDAAGKGSFSPANSHTTTWTAPATAGTYQVTATVSDGNGGQDSHQWTVTVSGSQPGNHAPVINSFSPTTDPQVGISGTVQFSVQATDADSDTLSYAWDAAGKGSFSPANSHTTTWTAPATTGTYPVTVTVSDGKGGQDSHQWTVTVSGSVVNIVTVADHITAATRWTANNIYVVGKAISVKDSLLIDPGTIVKFKSAGYLDVNEDGCIVANGSADKPIIFTSYRDDSHGGDTNGDTNITTPDAGDWGGIYLRGNNAIFNYCTISYSGSNNWGALEVINVKVTITNCTFEYNDEEYALNLDRATANTVLKNNTFKSNFRPLSINGNYDIDDSNTFIGNTENGIFVIETYDSKSNLTWGETEVAFVLMESFDINSYKNESLILEDGVVLKFADDTYIGIDSGTLIQKGNNHFTSIHDDSFKGNTDNATISPVDKWRGVWDNENHVWFTWENIHYALNK